MESSQTLLRENIVCDKIYIVLSAFLMFKSASWQFESSFEQILSQTGIDEQLVSMLKNISFLTSTRSNSKDFTSNLEVEYRMKLELSFSLDRRVAKLN